MKRITCFIESLAPGGAQYQLLLLAEFLAEKGYDVELVTYADISDHFSVPNQVKRSKIRECNVPGKYLNALIKWFYIFHFFVRIKTDCIISYRQRCNARLLIPLFLRGKTIKVICSERNTTIKQTSYEKVLFAFLYKRADYIVSNSNTQAEYIMRMKPQLTPKLRIIHNYTDLKKYQMCSIPQDLSVIRFAVFGRYDRQKNPLGFADAISELTRRTKQRFEIHWYGGQAYGDLFDDLKNKIKQDGLERVFILSDAVKDPSLLMNNYHALCLPSLFEGFSNAIAEGISSGKPMLVSNVSDNSIMVHHGVNGFLFSPFDKDSICDTFIKFFSLSYEQMYKMAFNSRKIAENLFDKERFIMQYISLIES